MSPDLGEAHTATDMRAKAGRIVAHANRADLAVT
jgi:hypothetical protein